MDKEGKKYENKMVEKVPGYELIEKYYGKSKIIDLLNIDIEGSEYGLLETFSNFSTYNEICQFNVELYPAVPFDQGYSIPEMFTILRNLMKSGTWVWLKADKLFDTFFPSYFLNIRNELCVRKFLLGKLIDETSFLDFLKESRSKS